MFTRDCGGPDDDRPIDKLPTEILCKIFFNATKFLYTIFDPTYLSPHRTNSTLLKITAVCKHWRSIALECAILWTDIAFSTSTWSTIQCAQLFLDRSKEAALSVYIWNSKPAENPEIARSSDKLLQSISAQSHRIYTCHLSSHFPNFWRYWASPAPNLRKLLVQGHGPRAPPAFRGEFPRLKAITLHFCSTWPLGNYTTLTHAELRNHNLRATLESLLNTLTGCTALESVILEKYMNLERGFPHLTPIILPRLQKIDFVSSDSALILEHLNAPSLRGPVAIYDQNPQQDILRSLPIPQRDTLYFQGITSLVVCLNMDSSYNFVAGLRGEGSTALYVGAYSVPRSAKSNWIRLSFASVASFPPFSKIRTLTLVTDVLAMPWESWFPNLNFVEELSVSCPRLDILLAALLDPFPDTKLPSLRRLALRRLGTCAIMDHANLMEFVLYRYRAAHPIRQLRLDREEWGWIQSLDETWVLLVQSQCEYPGSHITRNLLMSFPVTDKESVTIDLVQEIDFNDLGGRLYLSRSGEDPLISQEPGEWEVRVRVGIT